MANCGAKTITIWNHLIPCTTQSQQFEIRLFFIVFIQCATIPLVN